MCAHDEEENPVNSLKLLILPVLLCIWAFLTKTNESLKTILYVTAYIIAGYDIIYASMKNIMRGKFFDENFLMSAASIGAMLLQDYPEAISVMVLYKIGEYLQDKALDKSRNSIKELTNIAPDYANILIGEEVVQTSPEEVNIDSIIIVKPGERVPLDGIIIDGEASVNMSSLTGESAEKTFRKGETILSGCINTNGLLRIRVTKLYKNSTVAKILELIENAQAKKSQTENFITKFARYYTPCVVFIALVIIAAPFVFHLNTSIWIERALTFLVISCPCALVISIPLTFFCAIGTASKHGILIKGSSFIEKLAQTGVIAFDKTGTLTKGAFVVTDVKCYTDISEEQVLKYAAYAEFYSNHPIAVAIRNKYKKNCIVSEISYAKEITGKGVIAEISGNEILLGNKSLMEENGFNINNKYSSTIYLVKNRVLTGAITIEDEIKPEASELISKLKTLNIKAVMLTGDTDTSAGQIASKIGIEEYCANLLPQDKVEKIEELLNKNKKQQTIIFVGDGINDAPVLMRSDAGIAMGTIGSDAAVEAADIVISDDNVSKIYTIILIAKKTIRIAKQNIILAIGIKVLFLILSVFGYMTMWGAIFADVGVALLAILNAMRCTKFD